MLENTFVQFTHTPLHPDICPLILLASAWCAWVYIQIMHGDTCFTRCRHDDMCKLIKWWQTVKNKTADHTAGLFGYVYKLWSRESMRSPPNTLRCAWFSQPPVSHLPRDWTGALIFRITAPRPWFLYRAPCRDEERIQTRPAREWIFHESYKIVNKYTNTIMNNRIYFMGYTIMQ